MTSRTAAVICGLILCGCVGFYAGRSQERKRTEAIAIQWQQRLRQQESDSQKVIHEESGWSDKWIDCQTALYHARSEQRRKP